MGKIKMGIHFGALALAVEKQLEEQGLVATEKAIEQFKRLNNARLNLLFGNCITDTENDKIIKRIMNKLKKTVKPL